MKENSENVDNTPKRIETVHSFCYIDNVFVVNKRTLSSDLSTACG
jgi:hypothetical protein